MYKISEVISKPVYAIYEGMEVGTVINFLYDSERKKVKGLFIFDDESDQEQYIANKNIYRLGTDNVLVKNRSKVQISKFDKTSILNLNMISIAGEDAGEINDVFFDEKFNICAVETKKGIIIPADDIINIGHDMALFDSANGKKVNVAKMKPANRILVENLPNIKVNILEEAKFSTIPIISQNFDQTNFVEEKKIVNPPIKEVQRNKITLPPKVLSNPKSIVGKYAKELICGINGEVIIKKGQMVTEKIIEKAQKHSKLFELTNNVN